MSTTKRVGAVTHTETRASFVESRLGRYLAHESKRIALLRLTKAPRSGRRLGCPNGPLGLRVAIFGPSVLGQGGEK
jgi:hypothetical protein